MFHSNPHRQLEVTMRFAVCCSVLQCVTLSYSVLHCVAVCYIVLQRVTLCCNLLQCVASGANCGRDTTQAICQYLQDCDRSRLSHRVMCAMSSQPSCYVSQALTVYSSVLLCVAVWLRRRAVLAKKRQEISLYKLVNVYPYAGVSPHKRPVWVYSKEKTEKVMVRRALELGTPTGTHCNTLQQLSDLDTLQQYCVEAASEVGCVAL